MFENFKLSDIKGAPLSILVVLSLNGNRAVSVADLAGETGFSDKPIKAGLMKLRELGCIMEPRRNRYQLTGKEYQLPLYWDERMEAFGESPRVFGESPKFSGESPDLEKRVAALEAAVFRGLPAAEAMDGAVYEDDRWTVTDDQVTEAETRDGNFAGKFGVSPDGQGESPIIEIDGAWAEDQEVAEEELRSGNFAGKFGDNPKEAGEIPGESPKGLINNINKPEVKEAGRYDTEISTYLPEKEISMSGLTGVPEKAKSTWAVVLQQMQGSMDRGMFCTTLKDSVLAGYEDGHYTIAVKNNQIREWCVMRLQSRIEKILESMEGLKVSVSFIVNAECGTNAECGMRNAEFLEAHEPEVKMLPMSGYPAEDKLVEICNEYLREENGEKYSTDELAEIVAMHPDPDVLRFVLPTLSNLRAVKVWCGWPLKVAKEKLLAHYGIYGKALAADERVSLEMIRDVCEDLPADEKKYAINRIMQKANGNIPL